MNAKIDIPEVVSVTTDRDSIHFELPEYHSQNTAIGSVDLRLVSNLANSNATLSLIGDVRSSSDRTFFFRNDRNQPSYDLSLKVYRLNSHLISEVILDNLAPLGERNITLQFVLVVENYTIPGGNPLAGNYSCDLHLVWNS